MEELPIIQKTYDLIRIFWVRGDQENLWRITSIAVGEPTPTPPRRGFFAPTIFYQIQQITPSILKTI